ncbi:MAG: cysteine rich repeat-containing protein [Pseudolabrys sp.]
MMKNIMAICAVVLLSAPVAMAQERLVGVCAADIKAKCAGVQPGEGRIRDCLKTHVAEFSDPCKERLARVAEISKACAADIKEICAGKERRVRACIQKGIANIKSDQCKEALAQAVAGKK